MWQVGFLDHIRTDSFLGPTAPSAPAVVPPHPDFFAIFAGPIMVVACAQTTLPDAFSWSLYGDAITFESVAFTPTICWLLILASDVVLDIPETTIALPVTNEWDILERLLVGGALSLVLMRSLFCFFWYHRSGIYGKVSQGMRRLTVG